MSDEGNSSSYMHCPPPTKQLHAAQISSIVHVPLTFKDRARPACFQAGPPPALQHTLAKYDPILSQHCSHPHPTPTPSRVLESALRSLCQVSYCGGDNAHAV
jgi:hypothetical protein